MITLALEGEVNMLRQSSFPYAKGWLSQLSLSLLSGACFNLQSEYSMYDESSGHGVLQQQHDHSCMTMSLALSCKERLFQPSFSLGWSLYWFLLSEYH
jgi:hypothetical protein